MDTNTFLSRHNGPRENEVPQMLKTIGVNSVDELIDKTIPANIRFSESLDLPDGISEYEYLKHIKAIASKNKNFRTYIGLGYYNTITPSVVIRNILENPAWYTSYTPYQAEISQGRLEALLNFQTVITELTGMELANASLLDEGTSAAEAMIMMYNLRSRKSAKAGHNKFFIDENIFPQTFDIVETRAIPLGIEIVRGNFNNQEFTEEYFGSLVQYPAADGKIEDYSEFTAKAHASECLVGVIADILSLSMLTPPSEYDADMVVGSTQRLGIPMGYGGPHAGYFATREKYKRNLPGRIIGISTDTYKNNALRMALQTREQHIKREKATSNICTAQALLATMAGMFVVYHGPEGLKNIAKQIHNKTGFINDELIKLGYTQENLNYFDTLKVSLPDGVNSSDIEELALAKEINLRYIDSKTIGISIDETTSLIDVNDIIEIFAVANEKETEWFLHIQNEIFFDNKYLRTSEILKQDVFNKFQSETEMMRYIKKLERKDFSLTHSMISLGSCTMKLNAATEMLPLSWMEFSAIHPFVPVNQAMGYHQIFKELEDYLKVITGFDAVSFQPNSGAAGEYTGLLTIQKYHQKRGDAHRDVVIIPTSAHGTNPASAVMAGMKVILVDCDDKGNIDIEQLRAKAQEHKDNLSAFMVTYPSTHGVFESGIIEMMDIIHDNGGLVYMDGANMNAQVGLTSPGKIGADVCHLNLHKTFAIPHGGGGPGVGPIGVAKHLVEFLPSNPIVKTGGENAIPAVASAPWGSASVLTISHAYVMMMGGDGLTEATRVAILNANYLASKLKKNFDILYTGENGTVAHEMILDCRKFKAFANITETDIAKRLMDYGFHAPTLSFPVHGTLMIEPTESESLQELDRFIETMASIYSEIEEVHNDEKLQEDNVLINAPHPLHAVSANEWCHSYSREKAAYPLPWIIENKFFPTIGRIDDAYGDRNLMCNCDPIESYRETTNTYNKLEE